MTDSERVELLHGTLDLIVLRALATMGPLHAYALASRLEQLAENPLTLNQGTLYPALVRLEQRGWIKGTCSFRCRRTTPSWNRRPRASAPRPHRGGCTA